MKKSVFFLFSFFLVLQFVFGQFNDTPIPVNGEKKIEQLLSEASRQAKKDNYEEAKAPLLQAIALSKNQNKKNWLAKTNYSLAQLQYDFKYFEEAEKRAQKVLRLQYEETQKYPMALSHILLAKINFKNHQSNQAEIHLAKAENIIGQLAETRSIEKKAASEKISLLSKKNTKQQRSLKFNQWGILLGVTIILVLSLLILAFFKNIRIRNQTTDLLRAKNKQLIQEKNKAEQATLVKTQFLSTITHELRTPIYAVTGLTHLLFEENPSQQQKEYLESLKFSGEHLLSLINNILDFNKLEAKKVNAQSSIFILRSKIEHTLAALTKSAQDKKNKLHLEIDEDLPEKIIGDHVKLSQVIINLVGNAIRFTENGDVWVRIHLAKNLPNKVLVDFEIEDNGIGIPEEKQEEIFENFTQGSDEINNIYGGTGLGLPIVKGILQVLGSDIQLESTLGIGSKFYFSLKLKKAKDTTQLEDKEEEKANLQQWQKTLKDKKILIADDNKINQMITHKILAKHGAICDLANNGEIALQKAETNSYDLILMDVHMPGINGIEATKKIRKKDQKTPILALTAVVLDENLETFLNNGFNDVIPKPYKTGLFFQKIHEQILSSNQ